LRRFRPAVKLAGHVVECQPVHFRSAKRGVPNTIKNIENGISDPKRSTMLLWKRALEQAGVEFLDQTDDGRGEGVRFRTA
jgi:hypothetical protein